MVELRHRLPNSQSHTMNVLYTLRPSNGPKQWTRERHEKSDRRQNELEPKRKKKQKEKLEWQNLSGLFVPNRFCFSFVPIAACRRDGVWVKTITFSLISRLQITTRNRPEKKQNFFPTYFRFFCFSPLFDLGFASDRFECFPFNVFRAEYAGHKSTMPTGYSFRFLADNVAFNTIY